MGVYYSADKGHSWSITSFNEGIHGAIIFNKNILYTSLGTSNDKGQTWNSYSDGWKDVRTFYSFNENIYSGTSHGVYIYNKEENNWVSKNRGIKGEDFFANDSIITSFTNIDDILYCGTFNKGIFYSEDFGETWIKSNTTFTSVNKMFNYKNFIYVFTYTGEVFVTEDSCKSWNSITPDLGISILYDACIYKDILTISTSSGLYQINDYNKNWIQLNDESYNLLFVSDSILFGGNHFGLFRWNPELNLFNLTNKGINTAGVLDMTIFNNRLYCSTDVGTFFTMDDGNNWELIPETKNQSCYAITQSDSMILIGTNKSGIIYSTLGSNDWQQLNNGLTSSVIWDIESNGKTLFAATDDGPFISKNSGKNWISIVNGFIHDNPSSTLGTDQVQALSIITASGLVLASNNFGLYKLSEDSARWELVGFSENGGKMIKIIEDVVYFAPESGGLFKSTDSCKTWISLDLNTIVYDLFKRGDKNLYASTLHHIYYSSNEGETWNNWSETGTPNLFIYRMIQGDSSIYAGTYGKSIYKREYLDLIDCSSPNYEINGSVFYNIPINTTADEFKSNLTLAHGASSDIYNNIHIKANQDIIEAGDEVIVTAEDGKTSKNYRIEVITDINEATKSGFSIYPTLTQSKIYFNDPKKVNEIIIYDSNGKMLYYKLSDVNPIDVSTYVNGVYIVKILLNDGRKLAYKIMKI
jgi:ligand-binding sensor domain-containing protein